MRDIKFRAWTGKEYVYDWLSIVSYKPEGVEVAETFSPRMRMKTAYCVEQFTGLTDKNGVEIYEGDIVRWPYGISEVVYDYGGFYPFSQPGDSAPNADNEAHVEVIGNIHLNPELLEQS